MPSLTWKGLESQYRDWHAPMARLTVGGAPFEAGTLELVECETGVELSAGVCGITILGLYDQAGGKFTCEGTLVPGAPVVLEMGYIVTKPVFYGYLYEAEYELGLATEPAVTIRCMDVKGAMMGGGTLDISGGLTYRQVIQGFFSGKNARGYQSLCGAPAMSGLPELDRPVGQLPARMDDYEFLAGTARRFGLECFVSDGGLVLRKKPASASPLLSISPDEADRISCAVSSVGYVRSVTVYGGTDDERDGEKKRAKGTAENPCKLASGKAKAAVAQRELELFCAGARDAKAAGELAEAQLRLRRERSGEITIRLRGLPDLKPGGFVTLERVTPGFNGPAYIVSVSHRLDGDAFTTTIRCRKD